jgi:hypothetical protein
VVDDSYVHGRTPLIGLALGIELVERCLYSERRTLVEDASKCRWALAKQTGPPNEQAASASGAAPNGYACRLPTSTLARTGHLNEQSR